MGKESFTRNILLQLHQHGLYKRTLSTIKNATTEAPDTGSGYNVHDQFGIVIIPENGAPCGDMVCKIAFTKTFLLSNNALFALRVSVL